jgi:hypothetical protein
MSSGGKKARAKANRAKQEATAAPPTAHVPPPPHINLTEVRGPKRHDKDYYNYANS